MTSTHTVTALSRHARVTIDYDTGQTQLRPALDQQTDADAIVVRLADASPSWGTIEVPATLPAPAPVPLHWRLSAIPAVILTLTVRTVGARHGRFARLVRLACCGRALPPATERQARHAVRAVRWASHVLPTRWACLEQSTAAAVLLAAAGRRAEWRHGVATDPVRLHAWIADHTGAPVEEPADTAL
ncbi:MAG: lasso peptide biosynthesis B2 protein, partial [Pseudonocardiaceae bacterium]